MAPSDLPDLALHPRPHFLGPEDRISDKKIDLIRVGSTGSVFSLMLSDQPTAILNHGPSLNHSGANYSRVKSERRISSGIKDANHTLNKRPLLNKPTKINSYNYSVKINTINIFNNFSHNSNTTTTTNNNNKVSKVIYHSRKENAGEEKKAKKKKSDVPTWKKILHKLGFSQGRITRPKDPKPSKESPDSKPSKEYSIMKTSRQWDPKLDSSTSLSTHPNLVIANAKADVSSRSHPCLWERRSAVPISPLEIPRAPPRARPHPTTVTVALE